MCWLRRAIGLIALAASTAAAQGDAPGDGAPAASAERLPWLFLVSALTDEDSYQNVLVGFHLGVTDQTWLSFTGGRSRAPSTEAEVRADLVALGIEHDFGPLGIALTAQDWGDRNNLESRDWQGELFFAGEKLRLALLVERRDIDVYFSGAGAPRLTDLRRIGIDADGTGISGNLRVSPNWRIYGSWMDYDYSRRLNLIPRADRLDLLSSSAVTLALSFIDRYSRFGFERAFGRRLVNVDLGTDRSAFDGAKLKSVSGAVLLPVAPRMDLEFQLGTSRFDGQSSSLYGGLTLLFYGGG